MKVLEHGKKTCLHSFAQIFTKKKNLSIDPITKDFANLGAFHTRGLKKFNKHFY